MPPARWRRGLLLGLALAAGLVCACTCPDDRYALEAWVRECGESGGLSACGFAVTGSGTAVVGPSRLHPGILAARIEGTVTLEWTAAAAGDPSGLVGELSDLTVSLPAWDTVPRLELLGDCAGATAEVQLARSAADAPGSDGEPPAAVIESSAVELVLDTNASGDSRIRIHAAPLRLADPNAGYTLSRLRITVTGAGCEVFGVRVTREPVAVECLG